MGSVMSEIEDIVEKHLDVMKELIEKSSEEAEYNMSICKVDSEYNYEVGEGGLYNLKPCKGELIATFHTHLPDGDEAPSYADIDVATLEKPHKYICIGGKRGKKRYIKCWLVDEEKMYEALLKASEALEEGGSWKEYNEAYESVYKPILSLEF